MRPSLVFILLTHGLLKLPVGLADLPVSACFEFLLESL